MAIEHSASENRRLTLAPTRAGFSIVDAVKRTANDLAVSLALTKLKLIEAAAAGLIGASWPWSRQPAFAGDRAN